MGIMSTAKKKLREVVGESRGASGDYEVAGVYEPKPFSASYSNGMFQGNDNSLWLYFKMPEDVKVEWTKTSRESADNQSFLTNVFNSLGNSIYDTTESARKDSRIRFHIPIIRELTDEIASYDGILPAHADFLRRMGGFSHPIWHAYFGVQLPMGDINSDVYGISNKIRNYTEVMLGTADVQFNLYKEAIELVTAVCMDNGMKPLDMLANPQDYERLTAWYGESDSKYGVKREMETTGLALPEHGKSIFAAGSELSFFSVKPSDSQDMFMQDPFEEVDVRFGKALLQPTVNCVHINIRGEIRSPNAAANLFDRKVTKVDYKKSAGQDSESSSVSDRQALDETGKRAEVATSEAGRLRYAWLDNVELTAATIVDGRTQKIGEALSPYGLDAVNVTQRQQLALHSTVPGYPNPIFKVPAHNNKRNPNVNNFYSGVLSLSGLFRSTKPCGPSGILMGLSDSGYEFKEIFTETDAAFKYNMEPLTLISGVTGSGKATSLDTIIPTPYGDMTMGDIEVGDVVYGPDGKPTNVTFVTPVQNDRTVYTMTLGDGQTFTIDGNHQWLIRDNFTDADSSYNEKIDKILSALHEKKGSLPKGNEVNLARLTRFVRDIGGDEIRWNSRDVLSAVLEFVDVYPQSYLGPRTEREEPLAVYDKAQALWGIEERLRQKRSTVSYHSDADMTRMSTREMYEYGARKRYRMGEGRWSMRPQFSIYASNPVINDEDMELDFSPYLLGLYLSMKKTPGNAISPRSTWATGRAEDIIHSIGARIAAEMDKAGYSYTNGVYGTVRAESDFFSDMSDLIIEDEVPYSIRSASLEDRIAFGQGLVDGSCDFNTSKNRFTVEISNDTLRDSATSILRSTGISVFSSKTSGSLSFFHKDILAGDTSPVENPEEVQRIQRIIPITDIIETNSVPVKCIEVDNEYHTYLVGDYVPTSNTIQMLMMLAQVVYMGQQGIFLNPKPQSSLKPFFDLLGGVTINLDNDYLNKNPGLLDPVFFLDDKEEVGRLLADMIIRAQKMNAETNAATESVRSMEELTTELIERAKMPANKCSSHIIFGNKKAGTPRLSDDDTVSFVLTRMQSSQFWKATISEDPEAGSHFTEIFESGKPLLIEWGSSIVLPSEDTPQDRMTPREMDGTQSVINLFQYSADIIGNGRRGGALCIDEAHVLKSSEVAMETVKRSGRYWREANISLMLASQNLEDFLGNHGNDLSKYARLFIIMKVADNDRELDIFYRTTGLERDPAYERYMINAGVDKNPNAKQQKHIPNAYVIDKAYDWNGGIICGPWPEREMKAATKNKDDKASSTAQIHNQLSDLEGSMSNFENYDAMEIESEDSSAEDV